MRWKTAQSVGRWLVLVVLCMGTGAAAFAQDLPGHIPDDPRALPDRQEETLIERHRDLISQFFTGTQISAAPTFRRNPAAYGVQFEAGLGITAYSAVSFAFGMREYVIQRGSADRRHRLAPDPTRGSDGMGPQKKTVALFTVNYDLGLVPLGGDSRFARRTSIGVGVGGALGDGHLLTIDLAPKYVIPVNAYWHLPVGLKIGQAILGKDRARVRGTYVGFSIGVKMFFGHRDALK